MRVRGGGTFEDEVRHASEAADPEDVEGHVETGHRAAEVDLDEKEEENKERGIERGRRKKMKKSESAFHTTPHHTTFSTA